ncbi:hypothetical protein TCA2_5412 [Paenibacillus sp. TCA20]|uniref:DUF3817 domain-containing protein n=1 Tax=Paenibacillus urinalis TaxID=521520 RepID=A0AAX3MZ77_9BACL|nr:MULTISPECIES: DUF3817 domain-containing protein [Paenibacillus]WDH82895.1 DUF3817 domain-containing protein [Paenibacillus urinalis]GAK42919.1 hypothetical protein TCA2_5412 [Paenibacillus sp. TCA20]
MNKSSKNAMRFFSVVGMIEGISFILLLAIAMPLKYAFDIPAAVTIVGGAHGFLFVLYIIAIAIAAILNRWSIKMVLAALVASIIPFGPFIIDRRIRRNLAVA